MSKQMKSVWTTGHLTAHMLHRGRNTHTKNYPNLEYSTADFNRCKYVTV